MFICVENNILLSTDCLQRKNPMEEIKEKLKQQENELRLLRELVVKGFELGAGKSSCRAVSATDNHEVDRIEVENNNPEVIDDQAPELPLPVPDLL